MLNDEDPAPMAALNSLNESIQSELGGVHFFNTVVLQTMIEIIEASAPGSKQKIIRSLKATWETGHRAVGDERPLVANMLSHLQSFVNSLEDK